MDALIPSHCRMGTVSAIFLCLIATGIDGVPPKSPSGLDDDKKRMLPRSSDVILSSFLSGLHHNQVDNLLPGQGSNQNVNIYRNALKKHILKSSDLKKKSGDSLEGRSDPSSLLSTLLIGLISLTSSILKHKVAVLSMLVAALAFPLVLVVGVLS